MFTFPDPSQILDLLRVIYSEDPDVHASIEAYVLAGVFDEAMGHRIAKEFIYPEKDTVCALAQRTDALKASEGGAYWKWTLRQLEDTHNDLTQRIRHMRSRRGHDRNDGAIREALRMRGANERLKSFVQKSQAARQRTLHTLHLVTQGQRSLTYPTVHGANLISTKREEYLLQVAVTYLRKIAGT